MAKYFDPQLVNGPFDDPGLYVDLVFERRALLFDLGDITALAPRKLLRIAHVFVTHRHMDHFIGFDQLLRCMLGREKTLGIWGTPGLVDAVESKIKAYTWNLVQGYEGNLILRVTELRLTDVSPPRNSRAPTASCAAISAALDAMMVVLSPTPASRFAQLFSSTEFRSWPLLLKNAHGSTSGGVGSRKWGSLWVRGCALSRTQS